MPSAERLPLGRERLVDDKMYTRNLCTWVGGFERPLQISICTKLTEVSVLVGAYLKVPSTLAAPVQFAFSSHKSDMYEHMCVFAAHLRSPGRISKHCM